MTLYQDGTTAFNPLSTVSQVNTVELSEGESEGFGISTHIKIDKQPSSENQD